MSIESNKTDNDPSYAELRLQQLTVKEQHVELQFKWAFRIGITLFILCLLASLVLWMDSLPSPDKNGVYGPNAESLADEVFLISLFIILGLLASKFAKSNALFRYQQERIRLDYDKNFAAKYPVLEQAIKDDYYASLVKLNIDNLQRNYELVRIHSNRSFATSISVAIAGLTLIGIGLVVGVFQSKNLPVTYVSAGAGIITTFISSMFFVMYSKTVTQMKGYHDSLLNVQDVLLAFKVVQDSPNPETKDKMMISLLSTLVSVKTHKDL
jgi:hypothetical protein